MMAKKKDKKEIEEIVLEQDPSVDSGQDTLKKLKKLQEELKKCRKEKEEYLIGWQRAKADFINARKQEEKNRKNFINFAKEEILMDFIALSDNFQMALKDNDAWESLPKAWRQGMEHIYSELINIFKKHGLEPIKALNEKFDPELHHCVASIETDDKNNDHVVLEELKKGYKLNNKVVRASQVKIGIYKS
jgi:molecular chaperone GrpE